MSAEAIKANYISSNNLYRQTLLGNRGTVQVVNCAPFIKAIGTNTRFANSAGPKTTTVKEQISSESNFTKFRPVTSHPTTSLIASLYKQHSLADTRNVQSASNGKLPTLFNQTKPAPYSHKRKRELRAFTNPRHTQKDFTLPQSILTSRKPPVPRTGSAVTVPSASASWTAAHASITASGQRLLPDTNAQNTPFSNGLHNSIDGYKSMQTYSSSSRRPTVNYMPFYEVRGRGDGASVVDVPSIDIEGKKIENSGSKHSLKSTEDSLSKKEVSAKIEETSVTQPSISSTVQMEEGMESLVSVLLGKGINEPSQGNSTPTSHKVEKKVRFSSAVTTNKIDEPSYTEALIQSLQRDLKKRSTYDLTTNSPRISEESKEEKPVKEQAESVVTSCSGKEEDPVYITPVMKVVVTKRQAPTGAELKEGNKSAKNDISTTQRTSNTANKISNTDMPQLDLKTIQLSASEVIRRGTQATVRASTAGISRNPEAIARVVKMVPKRQTVVMPNFPKQPAWQRRNFPLHSNNPRLGAAVVVNQSCAVAVQGNNFNKNQLSKMAARKSENLRSRLTSAGGGIYISTSQSIRPSTTPGIMNEITNKDRATVSRTGQQNTIRIKDEPTKTISVLSPRNLTGYNANGTFTDFQPIPAMPDHINFCDPRKTELILQWLNDVNKKRNIDAKLRKGSFSVRSKASS